MHTHSAGATVVQLHEAPCRICGTINRDFDSRRDTAVKGTAEAGRAGTDENHGKEAGPVMLEGLMERLISLGKSQMDFYTGKLDPLQIAGEITTYLRSIDCLDREKYLGWIGPAGPAFKDIRLSDNSVWIFLPGNKPCRYVHIHPGRYSPLTIRVRSETLKSAIAVLCFAGIYGRDPMDLKVINETRTNLLDLSPVKEVNKGRGLGKMIGILSGISRNTISLVIAMAAMVRSATAVVT